MELAGQLRGQVRLTHLPQTIRCERVEERKRESEGKREKEEWLKVKFTGHRILIRRISQKDNATSQRCLLQRIFFLLYIISINILSVFFPQFFIHNSNNLKMNRINKFLQINRIIYLRLHLILYSIKSVGIVINYNVVQQKNNFSRTCERENRSFLATFSLYLF